MLMGQGADKGETNWHDGVSRTNCRFCQKLGLADIYFGLFLSSVNGKAYSAKSIRSTLAGAAPKRRPTANN
jgi:hypothetical protein